MRRYEQIYILRPSLSEEQITTILEKKVIQGFYVLCDFAASPEIVAEIERKFRIDDSVLKYLTVKLSDSISAEEIQVAQSEAEAKAVMPEPEEGEADAAEADEAKKKADIDDEQDSDDEDESAETSDDEDEDEDSEE